MDHIEHILREVERLSALPNNQLHSQTSLSSVLDAFFHALQQGDLRAAQRDATGRWHAQPRVKQGILLAFRAGQRAESAAGCLTFADKDTVPVRSWHCAQKPHHGNGSACEATQTAQPTVRVVPGGTAVRRGAYVGNDVIIMPPAYVNVGAYLGDGTLVDSHVLVGSCAQIGANVHLSAAVQVGGVLEPASALPVIVEDDAFVGGGCGLYEGVLVGQAAVLAAGVQLTASIRVYDLVHEQVITASDNGCLHIPPAAVVVPGTRGVPGTFGRKHSLHMSSPIIVKYRDAKTNAKLALESALRSTCP